uniref:Uncharacterized protein n=1 Tax=Tanacetum cinerariifolium TaxID=118510 RepID=A0A699KLG5_TANCI|nr:hypothetical protein [Tanacetum cinerariifolium]
MLNPTSDAGMESIFATASSPVTPLQTSTPIMTPSTIATITTISHAPIPPTTIPTSFSEYRQTNLFAEAVSNISGIFHQYMNQQMNEAVRVAVQIQTDQLRDSYQRENDEFLRTIDDNMKRIIKEQVKGQVNEQVSRILPRIKQSVNAQLEAEVLTRSSHSSRTSYAIAADLSEMEMKKILIEKMEADKIILDIYGDTVTLKRRRDDESDKDEGPSAGSDRGSKRQREGKELESASASLQTATRSADRSTPGSKSRQASANESAFAEEPVQTTSQIEEPSHSPKKPPTLDRDWNKTFPAAQGSTQTWISELSKQADSPSSFNELLDTPLDFSNFIMNRLRVDTLTPELLAGPTYELMKGSCKSLTELEYHLEEPLPLIPDNRGRSVIPFAHFINNDLEYLRGGKLSNLTVEERFTFNVSLRMFTRSIVIQRRVEDLQLGVESYQKRLNLTKLDTYRFDLNDGTLNDVRNALDDHLKGIRMQYLPQKIWRKGDKNIAAAMI